MIYGKENITNLKGQNLRLKKLSATKEAEGTLANLLGLMSRTAKTIRNLRINMDAAEPKPNYFSPFVL